jgi:hypothetical protein
VKSEGDHHERTIHHQSGPQAHTPPLPRRRTRRIRRLDRDRGRLAEPGRPGLNISCEDATSLRGRLVLRLITAKTEAKWGQP